MLDRDFKEIGIDRSPVLHPGWAHTGLTAIELMITLTIGLVLIAIAIPNFRHMTAQNALATSANHFNRALTFARQTAVSRNAPVTLCAGNAQGCFASANWNWAKGWLAFIDRDHDGVLDGGESILSTGTPFSDNVVIAGNSPFKKPIVFMPMGQGERVSGAFAAGRLRVCVPSAIENNARDLVLSISGRVRVERVDLHGHCSSP
ncbi:GspH/FimT family pseudopilin [Halothiobacillus diazotrophicus]|uniref:GspH/FimT family pseudopilin n=1 Tax=Halothiobacillus diazotrophicus TaxID=1860122 RepID=UPI0009EEA94D|nr:GspH/FimT family pseudopilin [Halothiobacillus diazotrophicus]